MIRSTLRSEWSMNTTGVAPIVAYRRKIVSAEFEVDVRRLGVYLLTVVVAIAAAVIIASLRDNSSSALQSEAKGQ